VVDAKAPLEAFLDAQGAADDGVRSGKLADHVRQVKDHVTKLGNKSYWDALPASPEMVVLFLPAEAIYMAALERDASLIDYGVKMNVLIASPLTLIALLRAASFGWNQQRLTLNATRALPPWRSTWKICASGWTERFRPSIRWSARLKTTCW
jgi:DNA recombination protein RmuC